MKRSTFYILFTIALIVALFLVGVLFTSRLSQFDANLYATMTATR